MFKQRSSSFSDQISFSSVMPCLRARNSRDVGKDWAYSKTGTPSYPGRCVGETRTHATRISTSRYARFRVSTVRDFDEDAQEALIERKTSTMTSRQGGINASVITSVSLCFATIYDRSIAGCNARQLVTAQSHDRSPCSREHMPSISLDGLCHFLDRAAFG